MKILLFDVDGTLISTGGAGTRSLNKAFEEILGVKEAFKNFEMAGKTDVQIIKEGLFMLGIKPTFKLLQELIKSYLRNLEREMNNNARHLKPGVLSLLNKIHHELKYPTGLLTGNLENGARIKLEPFGLNPFFSFGAFGSDHEDRRYLLPVALARFSRISKYRISFQQCIIVGDTPRDVACGKPYGAKVIAVATGPYSFEELSKTDADLVVQSLSEIDKILNFIV